MDRRTYLKGTLGLAAGALLPPGVIALSGCSGTDLAEGVACFRGRTMGTGYSVQSAEPNGLSKALEADTAALLEQIETRMSTYLPSSELSRFNASRDTDWMPLSAPNARVIASALEASAASGGAFDATVGPLVNLWGFGPDDRRGAAPAEAEIGAALERVGYANIELDAAGEAIRKLRADAYLDLSGIAKGHAVDDVAELLERHGHTAYLAEIGGELRARGTKEDGSAWRVAIERPTAGRRAVYRVVELRDAAIATSGDYRNFFDAGGQRYSHSIDPRGGRPVAHELASVSVIADSTMEADALSTALMIQGPAEGLDFAREHSLAAHFVIKSAAGLNETYTDAFARHLVA